MKVVSLIIVNWNGLVHLKPCLEALKIQTLKPDEIIVVDNASSDDSVVFLKANYPEIQLVELKENRGFGGGNIAGFEVARGDYIVLLNNDTRPLSDWLEQLVRSAEFDKRIGSVASLMTDWEGLIIDTAGDGCTVTGRGFKRAMGRLVREGPRTGFVFGACAGAVLYKRSMLEDVGFFDQKFFMNAEDTDLSFRAQLRGWKSFFCAEAVVRHRISASIGSYSFNSVYYSSRNHFWLYVKCMPQRLMIKYFSSYLVHFLLYLLFFTAKGKLGSYLRGIWDGLAYMPCLLKERKEIQARALVSPGELEAELSLLSQLLFNRLKR